MTIILLSPLCTQAAEKKVQYRGVDIWYDGADLIWSGTTPIFVFKDPAAVGTLRSTALMEARVLAIGGGGAGGTVRSSAVSLSSHPGGGGGGAGEAIDREDVSFVADGLYTITVGQGAPANGVSGTKSNGLSGSDTFITFNEADYIRVKGGGGGGGEDVGQPGGSGGGGGSNGGAGGASEKANASDGKGFAGGTSAKRNAAGGGGASEAGQVGDDSKSAAGAGGKGFETTITDGKLWFTVPADQQASDFTDGVSVWVAGGGGGGTTNPGTGGDGGKGGGGHGGKTANDATGEPAPGVNGTGSGGGGGGRYKVGAKGGDGVVIICPTHIEKAKVWKPVEFQVGTRKGVVFVTEDATTKWDKGDLVITYTDAYSDGGLSFKVTDDMTPAQKEKYATIDPLWANARFLIVGGGGGGGLTTTQSYGGGAGGGAGGFIEKDGYVFDNQAEYMIKVGQGGQGGQLDGKAGENGVDSSLKAKKVDGVEPYAVASGGGGGGAYDKGLDGGSGGGGSLGTEKDGTFNRPGGKGSDGQGFSGGAGEEVFRGGGGGGAGGPGANATASTVGDGGLAKSSDITGTTKWYGGGGGGAYVNSSSATATKRLGGKGGGSPDGSVKVGGNGAGVDGGATGKELNPLKAEDGAANTGSGGGGGASYDGVTDEVAGNGADGIVVIRLSGFVVKAVPLPDVTDATFDGVAHTGVKSFYAYEFTDDSVPVATNAGSYLVKVKIAAGYPFEWDDTNPDRQGVREFKWNIAPKRVGIPNVTSSFVYDHGKEQYAVDPTQYHIDKDDYCHMSDEKTGVDLRYCHVDNYHSSTAGTYVAVLSLAQIDAEDNFATNYVWRLSSGADSKEDITRQWVIEQAPNAIVDFVFPDTQYSNMKHPQKCYKAEYGQDNTAIYEYAVDGGSETNWVAWGSGPNLKGNYLVRVTLPETSNWQGDQKILPFGLWMKFADLYADQMEITLSGFGQGTTKLYDFPVPVRLREPKTPGKGDGFEPFTGFSYARTGATGKEMHFFTSAGVPIEHEVESWDPYGESIVWVRVPELMGTTTKLTLCWNRVGDIHIPEYDGAAVWKMYSGVWHMSQVERSQVPDASGNGRNAYFEKGASYEIEKDQSPAGRSVYLKSGNLLVDNDLFPAGTVSNRLTYSAWYQNPEFKNDGKIDKGYEVFAGLKFDATTTAEAKALPGWAIRMNNANNNVMWEATEQNASHNNLNNLLTTWSLIGVQLGVTAVGDGSRGTGMKRFYTAQNKTDGSLTIGNSSTDAKFFSAGVDKPLQLAAAGFRVDEARISTNIFTEAWLKEENNSVVRRDTYCTYGLVHRDCDRYNAGAGLTCDWWTTVPGLSKTIWKQGEAGASRSPAGAFKSGATVDYEYFNPTNGASYGKTQPTDVGYYRIAFDHAVSVRGNYWPLTRSVDFYIIEPTVPQREIGGTGGDSGRVLLMNADTRQVGEQDCSVTNQGWCATDPDPAAGVTWWDRADLTPGTNNILPGIQAVLRRSSDGARLWHYENARHGNTFPTNDSAALASAQCYLPASSSTALSVTNESEKATRSTTGWLMLRNVENAALYSPCYTNGIGTIYFDAVNSRKVVTSGEAVNADGYKFVVEVATNTVEGLPPVDTNCWQEVASGQTNWYGKLEGQWQPLTLHPAHFNKGSADPSDEPKTTELALRETTGGMANRFYRIHVPVAGQLGVAAHQPIRFRIRRTSIDDTCVDPETGSRAEDDAFILLDNVIVSPPTLTAELRPFGRFDESLDGRTAVGYGGAFTLAFPTWTTDSHSLTGRCTVALPPNSGFEGQNPDNYISMAQLFYRWRYLNQARKPSFEGGADWNMAILHGAADGTMATDGPLDVPAESGDVEFALTAIMGRNAPYYVYVDYTGSYPKVDAAGYSEEQPLCESRRTTDETKVLPSGGIDWYVRLRDGKSAYEGLRLYIEDGSGLVLTNRFELTGDQQWTARPLVRDLRKGTVRYRLEGLNPQVDGAADYPLRRVCWHATTPVAQLPTTVDVATGSATDWSTAVCDGATDYLLFQLDEKKMRLQVAHAEFQSFDRWSSAVNNEGLYVGSSIDTNTTSALTAEYNPQWSDWEASQAHDDGWSEDFAVDAGEVAARIYPRNQPFSTAVSRKSWQVQNAMWTYSKWSRQNKTDPLTSLGDDSAVQLEGRGKGSLSFASSAKAPNGLDTVSYTARVAQYNEFTDFTYFDTYLVKADPLQPIGYLIEPTRYLKDTTVVTHAALTESGAGSYDGDGSVSLVNYYDAAEGCYEFRVSRGTNDKDLRLALYRWNASPGGGMTCTPLYDSTDVNKRKNWFDFNADGKAAVRGIDRLVKTSKTPLGGIFLSAMEDNGKTLVTAGVCEEDLSTSLDTTSFSGRPFTCITYHDDSGSRLTHGSFGVLACNCPGVFVNPVCYRAGVSSYKPSKVATLQSATGKAITFTGNNVEAATLKAASNWVVKKGRTEALTNHSGCYGWQAKPVTPQKVVVCVAENGSGDWKEVYTNSVSGFTDVHSENRIRDSRICDVRLQVLGTSQDARTDIVINDVEMTQWNGQWTPHYKEGGFPYYYLTNGFVYTSAWVTEERSGEKGVMLQPTRATRDGSGDPTPVSIRSPLMRGLGLVHFAWRNADSRARLKVQVNEVATMDDIVQLTGSIAEGEQGPSSWETVATIDFAGRPSGAMTVPINRRYNGFYLGYAYYKCLVRLVVDREIEENALSNQRARNDPGYGQIEITEMYTWDLPEYDKHSWAGWNFRVAGWDGQAADVFANLTDGLRGKSGLLNNTLDESTLASREKSHYSAKPPHVQSPVFRTNCVAAVQFKARLYDERDLADTGKPAVVTVYGTRSLDSKGEPVEGSWEAAVDVVVSNRTYAPYLVKLKANDGYLAVRLGVKGVPGVVGEGGTAGDPPHRVAIDDICLWERSTSAVAFRGAKVRPFRDADAIKGTGAVMDIEDVSEQPLASESFGFQGEVVVLDEEEIITNDPNYPITVDLWYYAPKPEDPQDWGFENWKDNPAAVCERLTPATGTNLVFRSMVDVSKSLCPPQFLEDGEPYRLVQYHLVAHYYFQDHQEGTYELQRNEWVTPEWYSGFPDPNAGRSFSAFTLIERLAPRRAWINEVNFCEDSIAASRASQWIEVAIPSGEDMSGWTLDLYNLEGNHVAKLGTFGELGWKTKKTYAGKNEIAAKSHYAFYTVKAPYTVLNEYDGVWTSFDNTGCLAYNEPYAFALTRPTGIVEHRVVVQGKNEMEDKRSGFWYSGTNLVEVMHEKHGGTWTWAAEDFQESPDSSVNVITNQGALHAEWVSPLKTSPNDINIGQYIDPNWLIRPNGGYVWIYSNVLGDHLRQVIGGVTNTTGSMTVQEGTSTNIQYIADRWYQLASCEIDPPDRTELVGPVAGEGGERIWTLNLNLVSNRIDVIAKSGVDQTVQDFGATPDNPYTPAIMKWLETGMVGDENGNSRPFRNPNGPLVPMQYRGVTGEKHDELKFPDMYWLDVDPTEGSWELWGGMGEKAGSSSTRPAEPVYRTRILADGTEFIHTNRLTALWLELRNTASGASYPPYRLQGLGNEQSDSWTGVWTSATFKVTMALKNGKVDDVFQPMRYFVFDRNSFRPADDPESPYSARVEVVDPFSNQSPAAEWGWKPFWLETVLTGWALDGRITPTGVSTLKSEDLLEF